MVQYRQFIEVSNGRENNNSVFCKHRSRFVKELVQIGKDIQFDVFEAADGFHWKIFNIPFDDKTVFNGQP